MVLEPRVEMVVLGERVVHPKPEVMALMVQRTVLIIRVVPVKELPQGNLENQELHCMQEVEGGAMVVLHPPLMAVLEVVVTEVPMVVQLVKPTLEGVEEALDMARVVPVVLELSSYAINDKSQGGLQVAKTMAVLEGNTVSNVIWCSDTELETDTWKDIGAYPVGIGDQYHDGKWYRDGEAILTPMEEMQKSVELLQLQLDELSTAYEEGVNSI